MVQCEVSYTVREAWWHIKTETGAVTSAPTTISSHTAAATRESSYMNISKPELGTLTLGPTGNKNIHACMASRISRACTSPLILSNSITVTLIS